MRLNWRMGVCVMLLALLLVACNTGVKDRLTSSSLKSGASAGCWNNPEEELFSFVVRTDEDYELLAAKCFLERTKDNQRPPRPGGGEDLVYVSLRGSGCEGCLDIVSVRETSSKIIVEASGGTRGECEMLIVRGAWALIPATDKSVEFEFQNSPCGDS